MSASTLAGILGALREPLAVRPTHLVANPQAARMLDWMARNQRPLKSRSARRKWERECQAAMREPLTSDDLLRVEENEQAEWLLATHPRHEADAVTDRR